MPKNLDNFIIFGKGVFPGFKKLGNRGGFNLQWQKGGLNFLIQFLI